VKEELAEALLAKVMGWGAAEVAQQRAVLQDLAHYKYDEYQQFGPGQRFIESLALWLRQFDPGVARTAAYQFVRHRLVFISNAEMDHLVASAFPTIIRPWLIEKAARESGIPRHQVKKIANAEAYRRLLRQTLFLGLSDGAHTDRFRRANREISNEQIWHAYDFSAEKASDFARKLKKDLTELLGRESTDHETKYRAVCLLDDFTASGRTYLREEDGQANGKIAKIYTKLKDPGSEYAGFVAQDEVDLLIVIYVAAEQAVVHLTYELPRLLALDAGRVLYVVHRLPGETRVESPDDRAFIDLVEDDRYFDTSADDEHGAIGGESVRYGFAGCRLPIVLSHNTPNNSLFLLWAEAGYRVRGLFPRVSRHRRFV
jgi:hypothetical protein